MRFDELYPEKKSATEAAMEPSEKIFAVAAALCAIFGTLGVHFFYIGRYGHGFFDLGLLVAAIILFFNGHIVLAILVFAIDFAHSLHMQVKLLSGQVKDGQGRLVTYPGQKIS